MADLHWVSPLPPAPTDVAGFTRRLLGPLQRHGALTLWTAQEQWDETALAGVAARRLTEPPDWRALNRAGAVVWNIGNDARFHGAILRAARQHPGIVILHDTHLLDLAVQSAADREAALAAVQHRHGAAGRRAASDLLRGRGDPGAAARAAPMLDFAAEGALLLVTHNTATADALAARPDGPPVLYRPLPYPAGPEPLKAPLGRSPKRLVVFGYLAANRRLPAVIQAVASHPQRAAFHLDIYGVIEDRAGVEAARLRDGAADCVTLHGFVADSALDAAIADADLAINLRTPSMGEASGTQLRIWRNATASLVTDEGWYATLPPDTVGFVRPSAEIADIQAHLSTLLAEPERFAAIGRRGRAQLIAEHAPEGYAAAIAQAAAAAPRLMTRAAALTLAGRLRARAERFPTLDRGYDRAAMAARIAALGR